MRHHSLERVGGLAGHRILDDYIGRIIGWADAPRDRRKTGGHVRRIVAWADAHPGSRSLLLAWTVAIGTVIAGGAMLEALGPPPDGSAPASAAQRAIGQINPIARPGTRAPAARLRAPAHPGIETANASSSDPIPALLVRLEAQVADTPDGPPPGGSVAKALQRISAALPNAAEEERERVNDLASELYDRARTAVEAGKVDEEQRWLALGSILAPPPEIGPGEMADAAGQKPDGVAARQDITPNAAEAEDVAQEHRAASAPPPPRDFATNPMPDQQPPGPGASAAAPRSGFEQPPLGRGADELLSRSRVVVHYQTRSGPAASEADRIAASLAAKAGSVEIRAVNAVPRNPAIRYFYPEDQEAAQQLGKLLGDVGGHWATRSFTTYQPKPRLGTIELWIAEG